jgi:hypothetical protein
MNEITHIGKRTLEHIKECKICQYRYHTVMHHRNRPVSSMIRHADKVMKSKKVKK